MTTKHTTTPTFSLDDVRATVWKLPETMVPVWEVLYREAPVPHGMGATWSVTDAFAVLGVTFCAASVPEDTLRRLVEHLARVVRGEVSRRYAPVKAMADKIARAQSFIEKIRDELLRKK